MLLSYFSVIREHLTLLTIDAVLLVNMEMVEFVLSVFMIKLLPSLLLERFNNLHVIFYSFASLISTPKSFHHLLAS